MTPSEALTTTENIYTWRCSLTGPMYRDRVVLSLTMHHSLNDPRYQPSVSFSTTGLPSPKFDWLWDILTLAQLSDSGLYVTHPPPNFTIWFATTKDHKLLQFLKP